MADHQQHHQRSYRQRVAAKTRHLHDVLDAITERAARADASTIAPRHNPGERINTSGYADPTSLTVGERDQTLGMVERDLWAATELLHRAAAKLGAWAPQPSPDDLCTCPEQCCPDGCARHRTDTGTEHPTCRSKRAKARRRGEPWALTDGLTDAQARTVV